MPGLPAVEQTFEANTRPFVDGVEAAIQALRDFDAKMDVTIAKVGELQAALDKLDGKTISINLEGIPEDIAEATELKDVIDDLPVTHETDVNVTGIASDIAGVEVLRARLDSLPKEEDIHVDVLGEGGADQDRALAEALARVIDEAADAARGARDLTGALQELHHEEDYVAANTLPEIHHEEDYAAAARSVKDVASSLRDVDGGAGGAARGLEAVGQAANNSKGPVASWWSTWKNVVHWVVAGSAEFLAVAVPAMIALGSYALDAAQGFTYMYDHLQALYTIQEATSPMFGKTAGQILGIGDAIQTAQNKINGQVYELLGAYLEVAQTHLENFAQMGETVSSQIDAFSAKVVLDMKGAFGSELTDLISGATGDIQGLGEVFGNLGHIILNIAHSMPGLAEVLLHGLADISEAAVKITSVPWVQTMGMWAMAAEEFYRWGGLLTTMMTKIFGVSAYAQAAAADGGFIAKFGANIKALAQGAGNAVGSLGSFTEKTAESGKAAAAAGEDAGRFRSALGTVANVAGNAASSIGSGMSKAGEDIAAAADSVSPLQAAFITLAVAGVGFLIAKLATAKTAAQEFTQSLQDTLSKVSNFQAPGVMASNMGQLQQKITATNQQIRSFSSSTAQAQDHMDAANAVGGRFASSIHVVGQELNNAKTALGTYGAGLTQQSQDAQRFAQNTGQIEKQFGVSYPQALAIADGANIKLANSTVKFGQDMTNSGQQITDFMKGMQAMGAGSGAIGNDLRAVDIAAQEAQTKVQSLNQALDAFMQGVTGGTNDLAEFQTALGNMKSDAAASSASLTGSISSIKNAAGGMAYSLKGDSATTQQSWQQFDQALGSTAENLADWFRQAGSEGQLGKNQFVSAIKDMVAELLPLTQGNKTAIAEVNALAQQAGINLPDNLKGAEAALGNTTGASKQLQSIIDSTTQKMSNMSKVAQNLGAVLNSQVDSAISANIIKQTGLNEKIEAYAQDLTTLGPHNQATISALHQMQTAYNEAAQAAKQGADATKNFGDAASTTVGQIHGEMTAVQALQTAINNLHGKTVNIQIESTEFLHTVATGTKSAHGGMVSPMGVLPGYAGGGVIPGFEPGVDRIMALLSAGEGILNPYAVQMLGGAPAVNWLNRAAEHGGGARSQPGGINLGGGVSGAPQAMHVYLDGKEIFASVKQHSSVYGTRNAGSRTGLLIPGQKVGSGIS